MGSTPGGKRGSVLAGERMFAAHHFGEAINSDVLGIGYATPWLDAFVGARRLVAAMEGRA